MKIALGLILLLGFVNMGACLRLKHRWPGGSGHWPYILIDAASFTIIVLALGGLLR